MSELEANLSNYKLQLQQVEAALTTDPENDDLLKLRKDLQEVIDLTNDLIKSQLVGAVDEAAVPAASSSAAALPSTDTAAAAKSDWKVGDKCQALYSDDQAYHPATIDEILEDGSCTVTYDGWGNTEVTQVGLLKPFEEGAKRGATGGEGSASKKPKTKRDMIAAEREYKKKKSQKKAQRMKQIEEEIEGEKNKWLSFNSRVFSKTNKGRVKKSIFASPDAVTGKVGVGTCGVSGRPMTSFPQHEKWKK